MNESITTLHIKKICKVIFYLGVGDFWFEQPKRSVCKKIFYNTYFWIISILQTLAISMGTPILFMSKYTIGEKEDSINFTYGHYVILFKMWILAYWRHEIKNLLRDLLDESLVNDDARTGSKQTKKARIYISFYVLGVLSTVTSHTVVGTLRWIRAYPFFTVVTFWPSKEDVSIISQLIRVYYLLMWMNLVAIMLAIDAMTITVLVYLTYKFKTLNDYFRSLKDLIENDDPEIAVTSNKQHQEMFVNGLMFHKHILGCAEVTQKTFGSCYSITIFQGLFMVATCLLKYMTTGHEPITVLSTLAFLFVILALLATLMWNSGDFNYEAARLPGAIYDCGWELCRKDRKQLKHLILLGLLQSQKNVSMKAFGIFEISHELFVSVLKTSYSVFAVFY